jgi:hypothetical protein
MSHGIRDMHIKVQTIGYKFIQSLFFFSFILFLLFFIIIIFLNAGMNVHVKARELHS